jgi:hypothetical protein
VGAFEYLLLFAAIVMGLAVTDLAVSLHRLLSAGARVKWDWLAPLAALLAFLKIVSQWWAWHQAAELARGFTFEMFLGLLVGAVLLFLLAAAALPDQAARDDVTDLAANYRAVSRRYWGLFLGHWAVATAVSIWAQVQISGARFSGLANPTTMLIALVLMPAVLVSLILVRNRWWHTIALLGLVALYLCQSLGSPLP